MNIVTGLVIGIISASAGVIIAYFLHKSRPWLGIVSVLRDDHQLVPISDEFRKLVGKCHWLDLYRQSEAPLSKLIATGDAINDLLPRLKSALRIAEDLEAKLLTEETTPQEFRTSFGAFMASSISINCLLGKFRRQDLPVPDETQISEQTQPILQGEDFTDGTTEDKVYVLKTGTTRILVHPGTQFIGQSALARTRTLGRILHYGMRSPLLPIVTAVRNELQSDFKTMLEIKERMNDIVQARRLIVRAQITNTGATPEHLEPFGVLKIHTTGRPVDPIIVSVQKAETYEPGADVVPHMMAILEGLAEKQEVQIPSSVTNYDQGPQYVVVKPGDVVACELCTIDTIDNPEIVSALQNGMLSCELLMRRSSKRLRKWLVSDRQILGYTINQEKRNELLQKAK